MGKAMKQRELADFCRQLARIAGAGMNFEEGILLLSEGEKDRYIQRKRIARKIGKGEPLVKVLEAEGLFEIEILEMIEVGFQTGNLEMVFTELADYYEREVTMRENVKTAFYYPMILGSMLLAIMSLLIIKVLPVFRQVFESMGIVATGFTKWLFDMGGILGGLLIAFLAIAWLIIFCGNFCTHFKKTQKLWRYLTKSNKSLELIDLIRLNRMMALLVKNGSDLESALLKGEGLARQSKLRKKVKYCREEMIHSGDFKEALNKSQLFHPFIRRSMVLALKTGRLEEGLKEAAAYYERSLEKLMVKRLSIIEPISVGMISVLIGGVLLSVMLPLMNLMNTLS